MLEPTPDRIEPVADHPGAPWQVLPYERQLEVKPSRSRTRCRGSAAWTASSSSRSCPAPSSGATATSSSTRSATGEDGELVCGFHAPGRWDRDRPARRTACSPPSAATRCASGARLLPRARACGAWDRRTQQGFLRNLVVREGRRTGAAPGPPGHLARRARRRRAARARSTPTACSGPRPPGSARARRAARPRCSPARRAREQLGDLRFRISPEAFFQTNTEMAELLVRLAAEYAGLRGHERVFDLYCGIGTIGLTLAAARPRGPGRRDRRAPPSPTRSRTRASTRSPTPRFFAGDIRLAMRELVEQAGKPGRRASSTRRAPGSRRRSCAASSRPRRGGSSTSPATRRRSRPTPRSSSRPATRCKRVRPVDMFPQTPHIECVALLERA